MKEVFDSYKSAIEIASVDRGSLWAVVAKFKNEPEDRLSLEELTELTEMVKLKSGCNDIPVIRTSPV